MKSEPFIEVSVQTETLGPIIQEIVQMADPEKILLISASYRYDVTEDIFLKNPVKEFRSSDYHLLVLTDRRDKKSLIELEIRISRRLYKRGNPHLHIMDICEFNEYVALGDVYFTFLSLNAIFWYERTE